MPSCQKFFDKLADCLIASTCVQTDSLKPTECLDLLIQAKTHARIERDNAVTGAVVESYMPDKKAPTECIKAHQLYSECRVMLMNPKSRLRGPYGGWIFNISCGECGRALRSDCVERRTRRKPGLASVPLLSVRPSHSNHPPDPWLDQSLPKIQEMADIKLLSISTEKYLSAAFKQSPRTAQECEMLVSISHALNLTPVFWTLIQSPSTLPNHIVLQFRMAGILMYLLGADSGESLMSLVFALQLLELYVPVEQDEFETFVMLLIDLKTIVGMELIVDIYRGSGTWKEPVWRRGYIQQHYPVGFYLEAYGWDAWHIQTFVRSSSGGCTAFVWR